MFRSILTFGLAAGVIVGVPMFWLLTQFGEGSLLTGYTLMLLALSLIFVGVKRHRDRALGGVIRFLPALGMGLGISAVAGLVYVVGWEFTLAVTDFRFIEEYSNAAVEAARARGASAAELQDVVEKMNEFRQSYTNPLVRLPMTFIEIFPVGVLISLVSAALLRNSRFLPARVRNGP
jgi:hypothetical protein